MLLFDRSSRIAKDGGIGRHVRNNHRSGTYSGILTYLYTGHNRDARAYKRSILDLHAGIDHRTGADLYKIPNLYLMFNRAIGVEDAMLPNACGCTNRYFRIDEVPMPNSGVGSDIGRFMDGVDGLCFSPFIEELHQKLAVAIVIDGDKSLTFLPDQFQKAVIFGVPKDRDGIDFFAVKLLILLQKAVNIYFITIKNLQSRNGY